MSESLRYDRIGAPARVRPQPIRADDGYVAVTAALFALGAYRAATWPTERASSRSSPPSPA